MAQKKLLLHACCAPCSVAIIDELRSSYDMTVLFCNSNIYPEEEYLKRKAEVIRVCRQWQVPMVDMDYDNQAWEREFAAIPQDRERGARCSACYRQRLETAAHYARDNGFDLFASSLSSGRTKKTTVINAIGQAVAEAVGLPFLDQDWKKGGRWEKGLALVKEMAIYRQDYCGCRWSAEQRSQAGQFSQADRAAL
jgi:predicted adenine nucleotide alpha hydrolase (AANH) superfamily ATPase